MNTTYKLVEMAKEKTGIESDYGIAKLIGVTAQKMSNWKTGQSEGNAINTLKLMKAAGLSVDEALKIMTKETANALPASNESATDVYYVKLQKLKIELKAKLLNFSIKHNLQPLSVYLLQAN